jgi:hypothetical protein
VKTIRQKSRWWKSKWFVRSLIAVTILTVAGLLVLREAYFSNARLDGDVYVFVCACGPHARISNGKVILTERNHDRPAGTVVASIKTEGSVCILTWLAVDGIAGQTDRLQIDHLGAKYDTAFGGGMEPNYIILVDNWKLHAASLMSRFKHWLDDKCDFAVAG